MTAQLGDQSGTEVPDPEASGGVPSQGTTGQLWPALGGTVSPVTGSASAVPAQNNPMPRTRSPCCQLFSVRLTEGSASAPGSKMASMLHGCGEFGGGTSARPPSTPGDWGGRQGAPVDDRHLGDLVFSAVAADGVGAGVGGRAGHPRRRR